jgi:hypothetical protein
METTTDIAHQIEDGGYPRATASLPAFTQRLADNRLTEMSGWDDRLLAETLKELSELELDFSIEATGFTVGEIDLRIEGLTSMSSHCEIAGRTRSGGKRPLTCLAIFCFVFWLIGFRPINWATWMVRVGVCSTLRGRPRKQASAPWTWGAGPPN